jgi:PAS domain-containing protein
MPDENANRLVSNATLRNEIVETIAVSFPEFEVTEQRADAIIFQDSEGSEFQILLENMRAVVDELPHETLDERRRIYEEYVRCLQRGESAFESSANCLLDQLMPRIIHRDQLENMVEQFEMPIPHRPLGDLPLVAVYVIDLPESVAFVNDSTAQQMGLSEPELFERALANLDPEGEFIRQLGQFSAGRVAVVKTEDSYDAARLLLVPQAIDDDVTVCAAVPDRDTLVLAILDEDTVYATVDEMAKSPGSNRLIFDSAIEVRTTGFTTRT